MTDPRNDCARSRRAPSFAVASSFRPSPCFLRRRRDGGLGLFFIGHSVVHGAWARVATVCRTGLIFDINLGRFARLVTHGPTDCAVSNHDMVTISHYFVRKTMWIPAPVYERLPQFLLLVGLLFMSSGIYLGFGYTWTWVYFGTGVVCSAWAIRVFMIRRAFRNAPREEQADAAVSQG